MTLSICASGKSGKPKSWPPLTISTAEVDVLLESARGAGFTVADQETGEPHPLPPELQTVAHRVLQEMLTNAIRHGSRKAPIRVARLCSSPKMTPRRVSCSAVMLRTSCSSF